jgi:serine/threonine-protein kinase RsbW
MRTAIFPAKYDQLDAIRDFSAKAALDAGMDDSEVYTIKLAVDEACTNIIEHAYNETVGGNIECTCDAKGDTLTIIIRDHGRSFDAENVSSPDFSEDLDERRIGGLGLFLMRKLMDEVRFETSGEGGNILTMVKRRRSGK